MNLTQTESVVENLIRKVKSYLISTIGHTAEDASAEEFYRALCYAIREETMINWMATARTVAQQKVRIVYYFSLEYLPGRLFFNNITNLCSNEVVRIVLQKMNRNFRDIIECEDDPGLGNGGLGRLASCFLDSLATHHYPAQAYGLRYQYGIFEQQIWDGVQVEAPDCWLFNENPWEFRRDQRRLHVKFCGTPKTSFNIHGDEIMDLMNAEEVGALPYDYPIVGYSKHSDFSVVTLRLWSTKDSPRNFLLQRFNAGRLDQAAENTTLTDVLYPNDNTELGKRLRLKQEFLLVSASLQDIIRHHLVHFHNFRQFADKVRIQINDTHPALVIPELIRILTKHYDLPWKTAFEITLACTGYTNHTILSEALEQWEQPLLYYLLPRQYKIIERINQDFCNSIRVKYPQDEERVRHMSIIENGKIRMANLAVVCSHKINGVAHLHSEILKNSVFKEFAEFFPDRFINVTNGVTQRRWLLECNPELAKFITKRIGDKWITDFLQIKELSKFATDLDSQNEFLEIKRRNKLRFIEFINQENKLRDSTGIIVSPPPLVSVDSIFDVQVKRIHEYKRQLMNILYLIMLYHELLLDPQSHIKRTSIIGGKAAPGYETAKDIIRLICCVARKVNRDLTIAGQLKIIYLENYDVTKAEIVIPATDLSEQISTAGTEASGTGNMKMAINGALTIGTRDGANIEMEQEITSQWWPFSFGCSADQIAQMKMNGSYHAREIYEANPRIKRAVDALRDRSFAQTDEEHQVFSDLYHKLIEMHYGGPSDRYFTLRDLQDYYETQQKVEEMYKKKRIWAEHAIHNIAGMGKFSSDFSIHNYAKMIWNIQPCPLDQDLLDRVRYDYAIHSRCY